MSRNSTLLRTFPGSTRLLLHPEAGRRAAQVAALAGASDWRRAVADRLGAALVVVTGPRNRPPAAENWRWPELTPEQLVERLQPSLPGVRLIGAVRPRQDGRRRLSLLCRYAGNPIVLKLGSDGHTSLAAEANALDLLTRRPLPGIATPLVIAAGALDDGDGTGPIEFIATSTIGLNRQRAAFDVGLRTFETDLADRLADLPRPIDCPADAVPLHGDLTPWNLRRTGRGLALFDWESAGWGTPGSDLDRYRAACDDVRPFWRRRP